MRAISQTHRLLKLDNHFLRWQRPIARWVMAGTLMAFPLNANSDEIDLSSLQLNGSAITLNTSKGVVLQITPAEQDKAGSAFTKNKVQEQIKILEKQIEALQQELAQLQEQYASCQSALENSTQETDALQQELAQLREQYASLQSELEETTQELEEAKKKVVALQQELDKARNAFAGTTQEVTTGTRLTDNGDGTVTDNLTGLIWPKNANCGGQMNWETAHQFTEKLFDGSTHDNGGDCGLSDKSKAGDWRLPSLHELFSLIDLTQNQPALPSDHQFSDVQSDLYWSSSASAKKTSYAWYVDFGNGKVATYHETLAYYVWPVRGSQ